MICCFRRYLSHDSEYVCVFFWCLLFFHAGKHDAHQPEPGIEQPWSGGRKSDRQIAWGEISIFIVSALCDNLLEIMLFVFFSTIQVNTSLTDLHLFCTDLGPEGGKAIAKYLEVDLPIFNVRHPLYDFECMCLCFSLVLAVFPCR